MVALALLTVLVSSAAAAALHAATPQAAPRAAAARAVRGRPPACLTTVEGGEGPEPSRQAISWQEELETLLAPETAQADREMMLRDLLARGPEISEEVEQALKRRDLASLLPEESRGKRLIDDISVVQRQVVEDILPQAASEAQSLATAALSDGPSLAQDVAQRGPALLSLLQDPARAFGLVQQEARNTVTRTPEGLESPAYRAVRAGDGYEVREYEAYAVASTALVAGESELVAGGRGLNALTSYFFGGNADRKTIDMTTPVRIDAGGASAARMAFMLPARSAAPGAAPAPTDGAVVLERREAQTLALREFPGFATAAEVVRQRDALLRQLQRDGVPLLDPSGAEHVLLQYNPPYTLPFLRRNEVGLAVAPAAPPADAEEEAGAPADEATDGAAAEGTGLPIMEEEEEDSAPSD